jgi:hypothetical protein
LDNIKWEGAWKEAVMASFKTLSHYSLLENGLLGKKQMYAAV